MDKITHSHVKVLWDYMHMNMPLEKADYIVGFGCYNEEIALRAAELYRDGWAPKVVFTGGLGRNTKNMWTQPEAERFSAIAQAQGVPAEDIFLETQSTNTGENILFTKKLLEGQPVRRIIGIHKPFMERRLYAAMKVYWPEMDCIITSPQEDMETYIRLSQAQGIGEKQVIEILVGDFQRMDVYAQKGYQIPQTIPDCAWNAFHALVELGYTAQLVR